jgi:CRISPR-associated protein Cmr3
MWYKIKPLDTLFFRDGRPFTMGSETWAEPIFPPYPSTVYGAIWTWLIFERGGLKEFEDGKYNDELGRIIKDEKNNLKEVKKGNLTIKGPFICLDNNINIYFPVPFDFLKKKGAPRSEKNNLFYIDCINKPEIFISDYPLERILINKGDYELDECDEFLDIASLKDYLMDNKIIVRFTEKDKIFLKEKKTGIKRSRKTLSSEEGYLYRIPMIRLKKEASLFIEIDGLEQNNYPKGGIIQIGGEGKTAKIEKIENDDPLKVLRDLNFNFENKTFKLYFAMPAIFNKGWLPDWIDEKTFEGYYKQIKLKLVACSIGKYKLVGGWDLANKRPKPMYKAVPAGSVYYFKILDDTPAERIKEVFHLKNISNINSEEGFGLSLVGEVRE